MANNTQPIGIVTMVPMGNWNTNTPYQKLNTVRYNGATYIAKKQNQGFEPTVTQGWQEVWQVQCYDGGDISPDGTYPEMTVGKATNAESAENDGEGNNIAGGQAKNYYNLGAFDTYVSNGDGTATIIRKTMSVDLSKLNWVGVGAPYFETADLAKIIKLPLNDDTKGNLICNTYKVVARNRTDNVGDMAIATNGTINVYTSTRPIGYIQFEIIPEYQYEEKVIENQPIRFLPQDGELWLDSEWRKGLNLVSGIQPGYEISSRNGVMIANADWYVTDFIKVKPNTQYSLSGFSTNTVCRYDNNRDFINATGTTTFITPNNCKYVRLNSLISGYDKPMLNEGTHPYPYEPYYGGILRERDLYPIGRHYIQFPGEPTPAEIWAGTTWEIDTALQGRTIIGSGGEYIFGATGGSENHSHGSGSIVALWSISNDTAFWRVSSAPRWSSQYGAKMASSWSETTVESATEGLETNGSTSPTESLPPYIVVNYWKRTA